MNTNEKKIQVARPFVGEEEVAIVREVLLSGQYVSGKQVGRFEKMFAEYIGTQYAVAVSSGTAALYIALDAMGIGPEDEVIVPPITFFATVSAVLYLRAIPVFADIDLDDLCLSPESVEQKITERTKALIPVHLFGASAKMDKLTAIASKHNIKVLEDCAQAHGTKFSNQMVGSIGDAGAFSFFATKHMTTGEGGIITTDNEQIVETAKIVRNHGMNGRDDHVRLGFNNRMTEIAAAMGTVQLERLEALNQKRIENSEYLIQNICHLDWVDIPVAQANITHTYFWCPVMVRKDSEKHINALKSHLADNGIGFRHRYRSPIYNQPVLRKMNLDYSNVVLPNAEYVAGNVIGLPNHPGLAKAELDKIILAIHKF